MVGRSGRARGLGARLSKAGARGQGDAFNRSRIATVVCVVLTSNLKWSDAPGNVLLNQRDTGLPKPSVANVSQIATVARESLADRLGKLSRQKMDLVLSGIDAVLGDRLNRDPGRLDCLWASLTFGRERPRTSSANVSRTPGVSGPAGRCRRFEIRARHEHPRGGPQRQRACDWRSACRKQRVQREGVLPVSQKIIQDHGAEGVVGLRERARRPTGRREEENSMGWIGSSGWVPVARDPGGSRKTPLSILPQDTLPRGHDIVATHPGPVSQYARKEGAYNGCHAPLTSRYRHCRHALPGRQLERAGGPRAPLRKDGDGNSGFPF